MKLKLEDTESRLNTKLAAANENLISARNDVSKYEEKMRGVEDLVKQKETQHFELKGEIAGSHPIHILKLFYRNMPGHQCLIIQAQSLQKEIVFYFSA